MTRYFNHVVLDDFLPATFHEALLSHALENREAFAQSRVYAPGSGEGAIDENRRRSWTCTSGLGAHKQPFREAVRERFPELVRLLQLPDFPLKDMELELATHRNGCFFRTHIDTTTGAVRDAQSADRVISTVYYFHFPPRRFSGGELALAPLGKGEPLLIEPLDNRLVAFPSFAPHEVRPVTCGEDFTDARFAINCWLRREKVTP